MTATHGLAAQPTPTNTPVSAATNTATPVPPTNTPTSTPVPPGGSIVQTSAVDFAAACATASGAMATSCGNGDVRLVGGYADTFDGPALDGGRWAAGDW